MWGGRREAAAVHERRVSEIKKSVYQRRRRIAPQSAAPFPWRSCGSDLPLGLSRPREASMRSVCTGWGNTRPRPVAADRAVDPPVVKLILRSPSMKAYLPVGPIAHFCWPRRTL
jgi:hypothetical protein